ncbi:HxlR family transcriptional regulator [Sporosarcina sp. NCCP-2716]|uniref:winged helix-turn-helix transcriptional regulator n=1 Tax=Sporosarcina sp. NCCP-2716 TaxID=2943679 RepID=UPI0020409E05|nr:helix-turn-helix domain-containing protein [Sporosarcina sp. NCCP-2716]GKV68608.1 HxlR family transcriptional regulator [Sporosarcina sp. NCCP-2716]
MKKTEELIQSAGQAGSGACDSFHATIEFIGKRWMGIIIYHLLDGPKRYHELAAEIDGISDRLLTERLKELEAHGFAVKRAVPAGRKVEYELTDKGYAFEPVIRSILTWVKQNGSCTKDRT